MGGMVSSLVFRPPSPTPIPPSEYFYLDVDVPLLDIVKVVLASRLHAVRVRDSSQCRSVRLHATSRPRLEMSAVSAVEVSPETVSQERRPCSSGTGGCGICHGVPSAADHQPF